MIEEVLRQEFVSQHPMDVMHRKLLQQAVDEYLDEQGGVMKVLDLFSGIGGFSLGLERAGFETVAFCEYDEKCRQVLKKHWPEVPQYTDVRTLTKEQLDNDGIRDIGLICGGFPCQPVSIAGKRMGSEDARWLWPEMLRLVGEIRPKIVFGENVVGVVDVELDGVISDLEAIGYASEVFDLPACSVGLQTLERHIWILAEAISEGCERHNTEAHSTIEQREFQRSDTGVGERWDLPQARVCGNGERIPGRLDRLRQLGNAVPPEFPEIIGRAILASQHRSSHE